ncbi:MAG: hypothetical protein SFY80_09390 [Verrucomicrobiota bacterium]|nr:hypothetical protein [Verrucomicrobiota bacterium]
MMPSTAFGTWLTDSTGLPAFSYTGPLPCITTLPSGEPCTDPVDPFFLLGNYRLTAFVHVSGRLMLLSTDRAIARLNPGPTVAEGASHLEMAVECAGKSDNVPLSGVDAAAAKAATKVFGCGFARFNYTGLSGGIALERTLATLPSANHADGCPALLIELALRGGDAPARVTISDTVDAAYDMGFWHNFPCRVRRAAYPPVAREMADGGVSLEFTPIEAMPLVLGDEAEDPAYADRFPAGLRIIPVDLGGATVEPVMEPCDGATMRIGLRLRCQLAPGESRRLRYVLAVVRSDSEASTAVERLTGTTSNDVSQRTAWGARLPRFENQTDAILRQEMRWHAYVLHAMATWSDYTKTTFIPQGTLYEYALGCSACLRDHMQHALPACHYDADLARSVLRFAIRKTNARGHVQGEDEGAGLIAEGTDKKSDNQIYALQLLAEYLLAQRDGAFLAEEVPFQDGGRMGPVLDRAERWFRFLRDVVGLGPHGHIRVLRSDWNDCYHDFFPGKSYAEIMWQGESLLNTAQAIVVLDRLARGLEGARGAVPATLQPRCDRLAAAARAFRAELLPPFLDLFKDRDYCPKGRLGDEVFGDAPIILEPQGWALLITELPLEKRTRILAKVRERLLSGELKGARLLSEYIPWFHSSPPWTRDNGGVWYALNGPLTMGALMIDREFGNELIKRQTLAHHAINYPHSWPGTWTASDCFNSSLAPAPGGSDHYTRMFPAYCAHAHAWPLYLALIAGQA